MDINVIYMSQLKKAAGVPQETIRVEGPCTVQRLLTETVCPRRARLCETIRERDGSFRPILLTFVGDQQVDLSTPFDLNDGDDLTLMFPIAGG